MLENCLFQTTDGRPVEWHWGENNLLSPRKHTGFWGWAYRTITQISMVTSEFINDIGMMDFITYYPCITIWRVCDNGTYSYVLLKNYDEKFPLYCFCSTDWKPLETEPSNKVISYNPIIIQFLNKNNDEQADILFNKTIYMVKNGLSIQPHTDTLDISNNFIRNEIIIDNSTMSLSFSFHSNFYSPEFEPILNDWLFFFNLIKDEKGINPAKQPTISHKRSVYEIYKKITEEYDK
jgi:hypothetical protein